MVQERQTESFNISPYTAFKQQMLSWANQFNICCFFDDNQYRQKHGSYDCLLGAGANAIFSPEKDILGQLDAFINKHNDWLFGHFCYDLKNEIEPLTSNGVDNTRFPTAYLFQPLVVIELRQSTAVISSLQQSPVDVFNAILQCRTEPGKNAAQLITIQPRLQRQQYLHIIHQLQAHILRGDCYEINFCQEFFAENVEVAPLAIYSRLAAISPSPFACYYKADDRYLLCASPERYIKKEGSKILSQPMKGTAKRNLADSTADSQLKTGLALSEKDKSENVMVADLVRNDLSKICVEGSVSMEELFGVYTFPQVHQMVSTVQGILRGEIGMADILRATFPMGSMTGAPKRRVMELVEQYEPVKRGIFSGTVGYITPGGNFDFNVVIRSIMYNSKTGYLNYLVGSGITFYSDAESEYEECLLKAEGMMRALKL